MLRSGCFGFSNRKNLFQTRGQGLWNVVMRTEPIDVGDPTSNSVNSDASLCEKLAESRIWKADQCAQNMFRSNEGVPQVPRFKSGNPENAAASNREAEAKQKQQ